jgi:hypothetical protein
MVPLFGGTTRRQPFLLIYCGGDWLARRVHGQTGAEAQARSVKDSLLFLGRTAGRDVAARRGRLPDLGQPAAAVAQAAAGAGQSRR